MFKPISKPNQRFLWAPSPANPVVQADYDPANDTTENIAASAAESATESPADSEVDSATDSQDFTPKFNPIPNNAKDFYRSGLQALDDKNPVEARAYFERAWQNHEQLDDITRQSIQDQLTRLTMADPSIQTASQASQEIDLGDARAQQNAMFKKLQSEIFRERAAAERLLQSNPREALEKMTMIRGRIAQSQLDDNSQRPFDDDHRSRHQQDAKLHRAKSAGDH